MPISAALGFASALTLTIQFLIFTYLYSSHRVRFFRYLLMAWGLMSVAKGLNLLRSVAPSTELVSALINAVLFGAPLLIQPVWPFATTIGSRDGICCSGVLAH
jgi:hypothetical protein